MTTAHKPTYHPAVGSANQGGYRYRTPRLQFSSKDMPGQTRLKYRQLGQNSVEEMLERDLYSELEEREAIHHEEIIKTQGFIEAPIVEAPALQISSAPPPLAPDQYDDADDTASSSSSSSSTGSESEDESDDEAELLKELERIKAEREAERARREELARQEEEKEAEMATINANPLLRESLGVGGFQVKRRWDDDVVFKNQAADAPVHKKRFINDTIRNDFHVRFLHRYIR